MRHKLIVKRVSDGYVATYQRGVGCYGKTRREAIELSREYQPKSIRVAYENDTPVSIPVRSIRTQASR